MTRRIRSSDYTRTPDELRTYDPASWASWDAHYYACLDAFAAGRWDTPSRAAFALEMIQRRTGVRRGLIAARRR